MSIKLEERYCSMTMFKVKSECHNSIGLPSLVLRKVNLKIETLVVLVIFTLLMVPHVSVAGDLSEIGCPDVPCNLSDILEPTGSERLRFSPQQLPSMPIDQIFQCGVHYVNTNENSPLWHYLNFLSDGSLEIAIETDTGRWFTGSGTYSAQRLLGLRGFNATIDYESGDGTPRRAEFNLRNVQTTYGLKMVRYFDAFGSVIDSGVQHPIEMYCQAIGHRYNATAHNAHLRFRCPDQATAAGVFENTFEFNSSIPGNAFRQQSFYANGSSNPNPINERSEDGMFRRNGNNITIDFNTNPILASQRFSDFNELHGEIVSNGSQLQLVIDEFPVGNNICNLVP